jgi:ABC-type sugar transport system ATPase subunit
VLDRIDEVSLRNSVLECVFDRTAPWTLILTSEIPSILAMCDKVYEIQKGKLVEATSLGKQGERS